MELSVRSRIKNAWNAFFNRDPTIHSNYSVSYTYRPDRPRLTRGNDRSIITTIFNRISLDASSVSILHVKTDEEGRYLETIDDGLNQCLNVSANLDQTGRAFIQDAVLSMLDEGCVTIVPTDTEGNPLFTDDYEVLSLRTGKILEWFPKEIRIQLYNENKGIKEEVVLPKSICAIIENPFYSVMNEPNSTAQRLMRKLSLLDVVDDRNGSGKLDLIIQLPYIIKSNLRKAQAEARRVELEDQLANSRYGIGYIDGTERITQLNRSVENNLLNQVEYWTNLLFSQLGMTQGVLDGTADEKTLTNYYYRTIDLILFAITEEIERKFLSDEKRNREHESIMFFRDPFSLVPVSNMGDLADKFTRNEIMTSNEIRQKIGLKPSDDPNADVLRNKNLRGIDSGPVVVENEIPQDTIERNDSK